MSTRKSKSTARPLGVRGHQKRSHLVASSKAGGDTFVETADESTTMLALEIDPRVVSIDPQPFTVRLDLSKIFPTRSEAVRAEPRARPAPVDVEAPPESIYTPDFLAELAPAQPWVVESKSATEVQNIAPALARRGRVLNDLGYHYLVVPSTEVEHLGLHANLVNLRDAMKYRRDNDATALLDQLGDAVDTKQEEFALAELKGVVPDLSIYLGLVTGVIACDLRSGHLSVRTVLRKSYGDLSHLQLLKLGV
jgi:hypothetical protein